MQILLSLCMIVTVICNLPTSCQIVTQGKNPCTVRSTLQMVLPYQSSDPIAHLSLIEEIWVVKWRLLISCHLPYVTFKDLAISCTDKTKKAQNKVSLHFGKTVSTFVVFSSYLAEWPIRSIGRRPVMCSLFYSLRQTDSLSSRSLCEWSMYYRCSA